MNATSEKTKVFITAPCEWPSSLQGHQKPRRPLTIISVINLQNIRRPDWTCTSSWPEPHSWPKRGMFDQPKKSLKCLSLSSATSPWPLDFSHKCKLALTRWSRPRLLLFVGSPISDQATRGTPLSLFKSIHIVIFPVTLLSLKVKSRTTVSLDIKRFPLCKREAFLKCCSYVWNKH